MMKTVFITGISRGLGLKLTEHFLHKGYKVIGVSRTLSDELQQLMDIYPHELKWSRYDLSNISNLESGLEETLRLSGEKIDIFIDNAAILYKDLIHRLNAGNLEEMVSMNLLSPMIVSKIVLNNFLRHRTKGVMIHISTISAHRSFNGLSMYGATKSAIELFSQDIAYEYGRFGIRSNTVVLGLLEIGIRSTVNDRQTKDLVSSTALGRLTDTPTVINTIDFLSSEESISITGQRISIDAGVL